MSNIIILAETGSDIPQNIVEKHGIYLVPMHVTFGDQVKDDRTFPADEVCDYYKETGNLPKTSGSIPEDFTKIYAKIREENPDCQILYLAYSSVTTCSYQSGVIAAEDLDYVTFVDTKQVSAGQCAVVELMAREIEAHPEWDVKQAAKRAEELSEKVHMAFIPDTLEFLRAGGRVSNAVALCGQLLKIHPMIEIQDGYLNATKKYRGSMEKISVKLIKEFIEERNLDAEELWMIESPGLSESVKKVAEDTIKATGTKKINWIRTGGVITCHGGPGAFGIVGKER